MNRIASSRGYFRSALVIFSAILLLPWGNLALAAPTHCCHHCGGGDPGISSGSCCQPGAPGRCGSSGQAGAFGCHCRGGNLVFISLPGVNAPAWQVSSYCLSQAAVSIKLFPPSIFHPPEPCLAALI
ncbi:MAG: hypothetical protein C4567_12645 [Deltaproteobacteria bacterium]|nr:MAG: hypothetical protein C4567_12645 [Deltaproteobacteria bacterium]